MIKFDAMREKYLARARELVDRGLGNSLSLEEDFQREAHEGTLVIPPPIEIAANGNDEETLTEQGGKFRDEWVGQLAVHYWCRGGESVNICMYVCACCACVEYDGDSF